MSAAHGGRLESRVTVHARGPMVRLRGVCGRRALAGAAMVLALIAALQAPVAAQGSGAYPDVASGAYYSVPVSTLARDGVFVGTECDEGFCPGAPIDRKTMAVWVVRVLDGRDPSPVSASRFDDVDAGSFHAAFIERMAELKVTGGCGDGSVFCPDRNVTRAQMAVFISRAFDLPDGPDPSFSDVPDDAWYAAEVARLARSKITTGCGDGTMFCPGRDTNRGQMATFLWRAKNPDWQAASSPGTESNELSRWVKSGIVDRYGAEAPWLQEVWDYTDRPSFRYIPERHPTSGALASFAWRIVTGSGYVFPAIQGDAIYADKAVIGNPSHNSTLIQELAHAYTIDGSNAARNPEAVAAGWLYFDSIAGSHCDPLELYAETAEALEPFGMRDQRQIWWWECPNLPSIPTDEAVEVVSQAFSGRLPDWFNDRFQGQGGRWDYEAIWREVRYSSPDVRKIVVPMLRRSFGGYCSEVAVQQTLFASQRRPHLTQPWRDGGCEEAPTSQHPEFSTEVNELSLWVKSAVIDKYGNRWPWLKEAWDYTNRSNFKYLPAGETGGWRYPYEYIWAWREPEETGDVFRLLASDGLSVNKNTIKNNFLHEPTYELARMYIHNYDLARNPEAVVAGWLYFTSIAGYDCDPTSLYIDTAISLEPDFVDKEYWWEWEWATCNHLPQQPTTEASQVARQVFSGQVPDWFHANFKDANGQWDYQKIWTIAINYETGVVAAGAGVLLPMLRHSFGGYCSEQDVANLLHLHSEGALIQVRTAQPWRDGGCELTLEPASHDSDQSSTNAEFITEENDLSRWIKRAIIDEHSSEASWLQDVWNYTNRSDFKYVVAQPIENSIMRRIHTVGSAISGITTIGEDIFPQYRSHAIYVSEYVIDDPRGLLYPIAELARVYIADAGETASSPEAIAAGFLYFDSIRRSERPANCHPLLLYTDTATFIEPFSRNLASRHWQRCPHLPSEPTAEARKVVSQAFAGRTPDWFHANFEKANGQWDHRKIWTAIKESPLAVQMLVVPILRHSYGGYCSEEAVRDTLFVANPRSPLTQPWRDGGC